MQASGSEGSSLASDATGAKAGAFAYTIYSGSPLAFCRNANDVARQP
jgi:hypothetical protein